MRFLVMIKANKDSEAGVMPSEKLVSEMMKFNEELVKKGIILAAEGLHPSSRGARIKFSYGKTSVTDGPFAETKELVAGYWIWKVKSKHEAVELVKRIPNPDGAPEGEVEIREIFDAEDFGKTLSPELREQEQKLRNRVESKSRK